MTEAPDTSKAGFHGIWVSRREPLAYRVLPKCGCSSVGQILHHIDHGVYFPGLIHDADAPILKWQHGKNNVEIARRFETGSIVSFSLARNPYRRLLSSFADKIFGYQSNGRRYAGGYIHAKLVSYGVNWRPKSNIVDNFHAFVRFVAETIERRTPMEPDIHWAPLTAHLRYTAWKNSAWQLQFAGQVEHFTRDMARVFELAGVGSEQLPGQVPRENATSLPEIAMERWYGGREIELMTRVYADDFRLLGYGVDPGQTQPIRAIDVAELNRAISAPG